MENQKKIPQILTTVLVGSISKKSVPRSQTTTWCPTTMNSWKMYKVNTFKCLLLNKMCSAELNWYVPS